MNSPSGSGQCSGDLAFAYGHESKKVRLRAVSEEKESLLKYVNIPFAKKISLMQMALAVLVGSIQVITIGMVVGRYSYDVTGDTGAGIWTSMIVLVTAGETLWSMKNTKYWKLHLSFALHIVSMLALIFLAMLQLTGTIPDRRRQLAMVMFPEKDTNQSQYSYENPAQYSAGALIASLLLNSTMVIAALIQLLGSFLMALMTGRSLCCASNKQTGRLFELEIGGSSNKDGGVLTIKKAPSQNYYQRAASLPEEPPSYSNSVSKFPEV